MQTFLRDRKALNLSECLLCSLIFASSLACALYLFQSFVRAENNASVVINVLDFGATPNDETDDTLAIESAIEAASDLKWSSKLGTQNLNVAPVYIPSGIYLVKGLVVWNNYSQISGAGQSATILKHSGDAPVIHLKGAANVEIKNLALDGGGEASYGILAEDMGFVAERNGDLAPVSGRLENVTIQSVLGKPGIGFANTDRAHSWRIARSTIKGNSVGVRLVGRAQHTRLTDSKIYLNKREQVIVGDGKFYIRSISIDNSDIEGTEEGGSFPLIRVNGVDPLTINSVYFEGHRTASSTDIETEGLPSKIGIDGLYSNGGAKTPPSRSIYLKTKTNLQMDNATFVNTQRVIEISNSDIETASNSSQMSSIMVRNSSGPGLENGLSIRQGGSSWLDGVSLSLGGSTWSAVVGKDGTLWLGYNGEARLTVSPSGNVVTHSKGE